jgi:tRNA nucleotidyltransferase/poly(A) polymerase
MNTLPLKFNTQSARSEFERAVRNLPEEIDLYIVGGSVRNALIREFHGQDLVQRDYDQVITNGSA